jgi:hypothetical protein
LFGTLYDCIGRYSAFKIGEMYMAAKKFDNSAFVARMDKQEDKELLQRVKDTIAKDYGGEVPTQRLIFKRLALNYLENVSRSQEVQ